jgi:hypothetical protein
MSNFVRIFLLNPIFFLAHRNRYPEGMDDGQKTPCGHPDLKFLRKNSTCFHNSQTDGQTDREINPVWVGTPAVRGLEELFSAVLERFLEPFHALHLYCKN